MDDVAAIILAAGQSTRMITDLPKVLHEVCGRPMLAFVLDACRKLGIRRLLVVVGYRKDAVMDAFVDDSGDITWVEQADRQGTGHAVQICRDYLGPEVRHCLVLCGDGPLVRHETLQMLVDKHRQERSSATLATAILDDPTGYGRIIRDAYGNLQGIVEESDCNAQQQEIREVNPSYYCFDRQHLFEALDQVTPDNVKGEYYLTDALKIIIGQGHKAVAITAVPPEDVLSINSRHQLPVVSKVMQTRIQDELMAGGVTIVDPPNTWVDARAVVGRDSVIHPFTYIHGRVTIGKRCSVGPFAYLRDGTVLADDVVVGVFIELKNSTLGPQTRARHHSYIGDAQIGQRVNVGAGTIVANFNGTRISPTRVEDGAYIGSGAILVAPLSLPAGSHIDPGAVVDQHTEVPGGDGSDPQANADG